MDEEICAYSGEPHTFKLTVQTESTKMRNTGVVEGGFIFVDVKVKMIEFICNK